MLTISPETGQDLPQTRICQDASEEDIPFYSAGPVSRRPTMYSLALALFVVISVVTIAAVATIYFFDRNTGGASRQLSLSRIPIINAAPVAAGPTQVKIEPVRIMDISAEDARAANAAIPFSTAPNPPARALMLSLAPVDESKAIDCLAAAAWYEAGDNMVGQEAVAQVVLNRLRHPAFPKSVCGVVFQGAERVTGCQFTFTCDGALRRVPSPAAWQRAEMLARSFLRGLTFPSVGYATHYHTDWVVPYWSARVDKVSQVGTHLFFRWGGKAGAPSAFYGQHQGTEPTIGALASLSPVHAGKAEPAMEANITSVSAAGSPDSMLAAAKSVNVPTAALRGNRLIDHDGRSNRFTVALSDSASAGSLALMALDLCAIDKERPCSVHGRSGGSPGTKSDDFIYIRDATRNVETVQWNCVRFARPDKRQCMGAGMMN